MEKNNNFEEFDSKVDNFLRNQMTAEEMQAFKLEIVQDLEKKERVRVIALMIKTMQQEGSKYDYNIINDIQGLDEMQFKKALGLKSRTVNIWYHIIKYSVAACIAGIILFGGYHYYEYNQTVSLGNSQYLAYVTDISGINNVRGITDKETYKSIEKLFDNVKNGIEIKNTIKELETLYENSFIEGTIYNELQDDISWNLAIGYLKDGEREKPILILEDMVRRNADYPQISQPAQELIDKIKAL